MLPYLQERCIDILQPDCGHTGGISQMKKIAVLAETYFVPLAPHCTMSELGVSASLHCAFSVPFLLIHEMYLDGHLMPAGVARKSFEVDQDGWASLPAGPGLGVEIDESAFDKANADPARKFKWPRPPRRTAPCEITDSKAVRHGLRSTGMLLNAGTNSHRAVTVRRCPHSHYFGSCWVNCQRSDGA
jgi:hypothetical protein